MFIENGGKVHNCDLFEILQSHSSLCLLVFGGNILQPAVVCLEYHKRQKNLAIFQKQSERPGAANKCP